MKLIIHFMDGDQTTHDFARNPEMSNWQYWRVSEHTLIVARKDPIGSRVEYPLINIRVIEVFVDP